MNNTLIYTFNSFGNLGAYYSNSLLHISMHPCSLLTVRPSADIAPLIATASVGGEFTFTCQVGGTPAPRIQWSKEGGQLPPDHYSQSGILT